jgi:ribosome-binding protein aMBF1 (putative translation factor)
MSTPIEQQIPYQTIKDTNGAIQYVVVPYADFLRLDTHQEKSVPNEVVERVVLGKLTPIRAWREQLGLTQVEVAERLRISQAAFAQVEAADARPRKSTLRRVAQALGLSVEQLDF